MKIKFHGAAKMVTGSNYFIGMENYNILIDCGMFQGNEAIERMNFEDFPYDPSEIDFLILTHAHIDHSGRIPKLVKDGFKGRILTTNATYDLCEIMLIDSANIQESDVKWENKRRLRAGRVAKEPLYTISDAKNSLNYFETYFYDQIIKINEDISIRFRDAGHILGSAIVELWLKEQGEEVKIVFSGDLGVKGKPIINDPDLIEEADYLVIESTYGDRIHESYEGSADELIEIINKTALRGGTVIIPSFAVGRTQEIIYKLNNYYEYEDVEAHMRIPIYVDSPMAVEATEAFRGNSSSFNDETRDLVLKGDNPFTFENLRYIGSQEESMLLNKYEFPKVIISSSGMATSGRVRHHLKHNLWDERNSLIFVGYQAEGTLGRILLNGAKRVKLLGEEIDVKMEIHNLGGFSGHADKSQLINWIRGFRKKPRKIFVVHGEEKASKSLSKEIESIFGISTVIPNINDEFKIRKFSSDLTSKGDILPEAIRNDIEMELEKVNRQYESLVERKERILESDNLNNEYDIIKNNLIELQHMLMELNMMIGN